MSTKFEAIAADLRNSATRKDYYYTTNPRRRPVGEGLIALALVALFAASSATPAYAQEQQRGPNPMDGVAEALNLEPEQLRGCLGEPPARGTQPSESDHAALIQCLTGQNASLTANQIDAAMEAMRDAPPPPPRG
ncbi:hypothetical protein N9V68_01705 [Octadecabacter sp.]|nr:hypothetical protein [Octadecabacter sp.]